MTLVTTQIFQFGREQHKSIFPLETFLIHIYLSLHLWTQWARVSWTAVAKLRHLTLPAIFTPCSPKVRDLTLSTHLSLNLRTGFSASFCTLVTILKLLLLCLDDVYYCRNSQIFQLYCVFLPLSLPLYCIFVYTIYLYVLYIIYLYIYFLNNLVTQIILFIQKCQRPTITPTQQHQHNNISQSLTSALW